MTIRILEQQDFAVAAWTWNAFRLTPMYVNRAFGILADSELVGSVIFSNFNGANVDASYYGEDVISAGLVRAMARFVLEVFHVHRLTFHIKQSDRRRLKNHLRWFGAVHEGILRDYYGDGNDALQYAIFKKQLIKIAGPRYARTKMH